MYETFQSIFGALNNREIASGIWLAGFIAFAAARKPEILQLFWAVIKRATHKKVFAVFSLLAAHVSLVCWFLYEFGLWGLDQFIPTVIWYLFSGIVTLIQAKDVDSDDDYFSELLRSNFRAIVIFEFIVVAYTFNLAAELVIVPVLTFLSLMLAFSEKKAEHALTHNLIQWLLSIIGLGLLAWSLFQINSAPEAFFTSATGRNFILPIVLSVSSIPFVYLFWCFLTIEIAVIRLKLSQLHSDELKRYARRRFIGLFCLRPWLFRRAIRDFCERDVRTPENVEEIINDILASYVRVVSPPVVDPNEGWSPYFATDVLKDHGLRTGDYHRDNYDDGWWASAPYVDLDDHILPSRAAFYIGGTEKVILQLKLKGSFNYEPDPSEALNNFAGLCFALLNRALPDDQGDIDPIFDENGDFARSVGTTEISRLTEEYPSERGFDVTFLLRRGRSTSTI